MQMHMEKRLKLKIDEENFCVSIYKTHDITFL